LLLAHTVGAPRGGKTATFLHVAMVNFNIIIEF